MTMTLVISSRGLDQHVDYFNPIEKIIYGDKLKKYNENFIVEKLKGEAVKLNKKERKTILTILKTMYLTSISILGTVTPVFAQSTMETAFIPKSEILEIFAYLTGIATLSGVGISLLLLQSAGIYRMFRKKKEATEWTSDILKGLTQVVASPILVSVIAVLAYLLFGNSEWFIKPF